MGSRMRRAQMGGLGLMTLVAVGLATTDAFGGKAKRTTPQAKRYTSLQVARIELGRRLFFDPMVSAQGRTSCVACHEPNHGYSDPRVQSVDETGLTPRHSQPILDSSMNPSAHWDGEFSSVEDLVENRLGRVQVYYGNVFTPPPTRPSTPVTPPSGPRTSLRGRPSVRGPAVPPTPNSGTPSVPIPPAAGPGVTFPPPPSLPTAMGPAVPALPPVSRTPRRALNQAAAQRIQASGRYDEGFKAAFGSSKVSLERIASAIGAYCHSIESTEAPYDRFAKGDKSAISESAQRGLALFKGRAGCVQCHTMDGARPLFTDFEFHNTGLSWSAARRSENPLADAGRRRLSTAPQDERAFKTPTLRDVAARGPYMHDGSISTLEELVLYYAKGGSDDPDRSELVKAFEASDEDVADLVAFLRTLTGSERPGKAWHAWKVRPKQTRLRMLDAKGKPIAGLPIRLLPAGDFIPLDDMPGRTTPIELETDERGYVAYTPPGSTHVVLQVDGGRMLVPDPLLPDTLRKANIKLPIAGKVRLSIVVPSLAYAPEALHLHSQEAGAFFGGLRSVPAQRLVRGQVLEGPSIDRLVMARIGTPVTVGESVVARYEAWLPKPLQGSKLRILMPAMRTNDPSRFFVEFGDEHELRIDFTK